MGRSPLHPANVIACVIALVISILAWIEYSLLLHAKIELTRDSAISLVMSMVISVLAWGRFVFLNKKGS